MAVQGSNGYGQNARTDEKGQYRIGGLTPGKYRVRAMPENNQFPPEIRTDGTTEVNYAASYHPGVLLPQEAARVAVGAGSDTGGVDIQMVRTPILRVSGDVGGLPPGTQNVHLMLRQGRNTSGAGNVKPDGTFAIYRVNPGKYTLQAMWSSPSGQRMLSSSVDIEVRDANVDHVTLQMIAPFDLSGTVEFEDEGARPQDPSPAPPRAGAAAQAQQIRRPAPRSIRFASVDAFGSQSVAEMAADGTFHLTALEPARYRVTPNWGPAYVKSMRIGPTQVEGGILDLRNGPPGSTLTLVMSSAMGSVAGTVTGDRGPATAALVILVAADSDGAVPARLMAVQPDGTFTLPGVTPGSYKIAAIDQADRAAFTSGGNLTEMTEELESIEIHANDKLTKDLKIFKP